ncbi:MAG: alpha-galactosidase [Clostridiales bacterium]|nr:alpha-galactosidase [Clostridiales bacterium]
MNKFQIAKTPPMGWNSWDCYGAAVTEEQLLANADYVAKNLKSHGFEYIVCDIQWYEPEAKSNVYNPFAPLSMDKYSRLIPAVNRFPSSKGGKGFKPIADKIHAMGLKFGIHIMRGIPRQAVHKDTPILGTEVTARQIAKEYSLCPWNTDMYGVNPKADGAREYYQSLVDLYASWGVDFIKCDDICNTEFNKENPYSAKDEIELLRSCLDRCEREIVLSLSPGPAPLDFAVHLSQNANMWRLTGDFWDSWDKLKAMFERTSKWYEYVKESCWPDCDMLPLGRLAKNASYEGEKDRYTKFTTDEQVTLMNLWCIFRSPLMLGGELNENNDWDLWLITNDEVLSANIKGNNPRPLSYDEHEAVWVSDGDGCKYLALFNLSDEERTVSVETKQTGIESPDVRDLWLHKDLGTVKKKIKVPLKPHASVMYKLK